MHRQVRRVTTSSRNVALVAVLLGLVGTILGWAVRHPYAMTLPPLVGLGGLLAVRIHDRTDAHSVVFPSVSRRLLLSVYFLLFSFTVGASVLDPGYGRPFSVHVLLVGLYVLSALAVFGFDSALLQAGPVLATAVLHRALVYYASAIQLGVDAIFHTQMAAAIRDAGSLAPLAIDGSKYWYSPVYHLLVAVTSSMTALSARDAAFLTVALLTTVLPFLVIYSFVRPVWGTRIGALGGFFFVVSDHAISSAAHVTPGSLGLVFFALALFTGFRYLDTDRRAYLLVFALVVVGQTFNHQVSFFVTAVGIGTFATAHAVWNGRMTGRELALLVPLLAGSAYQGFVTKYEGPRGDQTIVDVLLTNLRTAFGSTSSQALPSLADRSAVLASTDALGLVHVMGFALLYGLAVVGTVYWTKRSAESTQRFVFALGATVVTTSAFALVLPMAGINVHFPLRWFPFIYFCLAILAAPSVTALFSVGLGRLAGNRKRVLALVLLVTATFAPYTVVMAWNYPGAMDGPVFDSSARAQRLSTTTTEAALYSHVHQHRADSTVVSDMMARRTLEHRYGSEVAHFSVDYRRSGTAFDQQVLLVDREYARTNHALYYIKYEGTVIPVLGPLPVERSRYSVVYSAGPDRLLYKPASADS